MEIKTATISPTDLIYTYLPANYKECLQCNIESKNKITADDIMVVFWTTPPKWVDTLFKLRGILVKPFGLKGDNEASPKEFEKHIRAGTSHKMMSIPAKSDDETILCLNDKHLVMYFSIIVKEVSDSTKEITATTLVYFHNTLGRVYFTAIYPFHMIVVKGMLKSVLKRLSK